MPSGWAHRIAMARSWWRALRGQPIERLATRCDPGWCTPYEGACTKCGHTLPKGGQQ